MSLTPGTRLGPYEIVSAIGAGGMGEVYKARDTRLDRTVAIKILPEAFAADADRVARFQREAKTLAALNHSNIAQIFGLEQAGDVHALAMEFVAGEDLSQRIGRGPIPIDEALPVAKQIAEALEAAHEQGIIHRDLKPANIKVTADGRVKVLDFGLAKAMEPAGSASSNASMSPTITTPAMTQAGMILGTAAYMSPEQARGRQADKRSDVWAFGVVLYEMLTGRRPFGGDDVSLTLAEVLKSEPDWTALPAKTSPSIAMYLRRCLAKDPRQRAQAIGDVRLALDGAFDVSVPMAVAVSTARGGWGRSIGLALGGVVLGVAAMSLLGTRRDPALRTVRLSLNTPAAEMLNIATGVGAARDLVITPDGRNVVYTAGAGSAGELPRLAIRPLDGDPRVLVGVNGAQSPFVSFDGESVGFYSSTERTLNRAPIRGGRPSVICKVGAGPSGLLGAAWGPDDNIIFGTNLLSGLWIVPAHGGEPKEITHPAIGENHGWPSLLPGGRAALFTIVPRGDLDNAQIALVDLASGQTRTLLSGGSDARYVSGHIVYGANGNLMAAPFDLDRLQVTGAPSPVVEGVIIKSTGAVNFSVADDGTLAYISGSNINTRTLVRIDRDGRETPLANLAADNYQAVRISPTGTHLTFDRGQPRDVWTYDLARSTTTRISTDRAEDSYPIWSSDGTRIVFTSTRGDRPELYEQRADGTGVAERLFARSGGAGRLQADSWSPDGTRLAVVDTRTGGSALGLVTMAGERSVTIVQRQGAFREGAAAVSPDGRWIAYQSDLDGPFQVYVERFPDFGDRQKISITTGFAPRWSHDGRELFYLSSDGRQFMVVPISAGATLKAGVPKVLFEGNFMSTAAGLRPYDVALDGKSFIMMKPGESSHTAEISVVLNWTEGLKARVPTK